MTPFTRRKFLLTAASTTAGAIWLSACGSNQSTTSSTPAASGTGSDTEVKGATLGFIALTDSAPLIIATEKGLLEGNQNRCEQFYWGAGGWRATGQHHSGFINKSL